MKTVKNQILSNTGSDVWIGKPGVHLTWWAEAVFGWLHRACLNVKCQVIWLSDSGMELSRFDICHPGPLSKVHFQRLWKLLENSGSFVNVTQLYESHWKEIGSFRATEVFEKTWKHHNYDSMRAKYCISAFQIFFEGSFLSCQVPHKKSGGEPV